MLRSIATVSLGGTLVEKLTAIAAAGFDGIEIFENDLLYFDGSPADVRRMARDLGLRILLFQPFRDFEAVPRERMQKNLDRAERKFDMMEELGADLMLVLQQHRAGRHRRRRAGRRRPARARRARGAARLAGRLRGAGLGPARQHLRPCLEARAEGRSSGDRARGGQLPHARPGRRRRADRANSRATGSSSRSSPTRRCMRLDLLSWSRHFRLFPGQGALPVTRFMRNVLASGYTGPISLEMFNDEFRAAPPRPTASTACARCCCSKRNWSRRPATRRPRLARVLAAPPPPVYHGFEFVEFAVDDERGRADRRCSSDGLCARRRAQVEGRDALSAGRRELHPQCRGRCLRAFLFPAARAFGLRARVPRRQCARARSSGRCATGRRPSAADRAERIDDPGGARAGRQPDLSGRPFGGQEARSTTSISSPSRRRRTTACGLTRSITSRR